MKMAGRKGGADHGSHENEMEKFESFLEDKQLEELYAWVDGIPLSRPKRNIARDFSDGVQVVEIVKHFMPRFLGSTVPSANSFYQKKDNWQQINRYLLSNNRDPDKGSDTATDKRKVFRKLNFELADDLVNDLVCCKPGVIEKVLLMLKSKIDRAMYAKERMEKPESEQHEVSPGRKGGSIKVGTDGQKGGKFGKKQTEKIKGTKLKDGRPYKLGKETLGVADKKGSKVIGTADIDPKGSVRTQAAPAKGQQPQGQGVPKKRVGNMAETDMVPRYVVEEKEQEVLSRDETIQILLAKIERLEHLLKLKDLKITELQKTLEQRVHAQLDYQYSAAYNQKQPQPQRYYR